MSTINPGPAHVNEQLAVLGYPLRQPTSIELEWFRTNPKVGGYAAEDYAIVLNPYAPLSAIEAKCVALNEALRLFMRAINLDPSIEITQAQTQYFAGTPYESDLRATKQTLIARIAGGDPSAINPTEAQRGYAECLFQVADSLSRLGKLP